MAGPWFSVYLSICIKQQIFSNSSFLIAYRYIPLSENRSTIHSLLLSNWFSTLSWKWVKSGDSYSSTVNCFKIEYHDDDDDDWLLTDLTWLILCTEMFSLKLKWSRVWTRKVLINAIIVQLSIVTIRSRYYILPLVMHQLSVNIWKLA